MDDEGDDADVKDVDDDDDDHCKDVMMIMLTRTSTHKK